MLPNKIFPCILSHTQQHMSPENCHLEIGWCTALKTEGNICGITKNRQNHGFYTESLSQKDEVFIYFAHCFFLWWNQADLIMRFGRSEQH